MPEKQKYTDTKHAFSIPLLAIVKTCQWNMLFRKHNAINTTIAFTPIYMFKRSTIHAFFASHCFRFISNAWVSIQLSPANLLFFIIYIIEARLYVAAPRKDNPLRFVKKISSNGPIKMGAIFIPMKP